MAHKSFLFRWGEKSFTKWKKPFFLVTKAIGVECFIERSTPTITLVNWLKLSHIVNRSEPSTTNALRLQVGQNYKKLEIKSVNQAESNWIELELDLKSEIETGMKTEMENFTLNSS